MDCHKAEGVSCCYGVKAPRANEYQKKAVKKNHVCISENTDTREVEYEADLNDIKSIIALRVVYRVT